MSRVIGDSHGFMSKARVVVFEVVSGRLTVTQAARVYGLSRQHIYRLLGRYRQGGLDGVDPRSRRPASNPRATCDEVICAVVTLREQLVADGPRRRPGHPAVAPGCPRLARAIHLDDPAHPAPPGLITPQPRKRPKSSYIRFAAAQPNECWQSDFTHWTLANGSDVEILNWLDDHSRYLLYCTAYRPSGGPTSWPVSPPPPTPTACPPPPSPTTDRSTRPDSPRATTTSNACSPAWASSRRTATPDTRKPKAKSNASTKPSNAGSTPRPRPTDPAELQTLLDAFRRPLQQRPPAPRPTPAPHTSPGLPRTAPKPRHQRPRRPLPHPPRHRRPVRQTHPAPRRPPPPPRHRTTHAHTPVLILATATTVTVISKTGHQLIASHTIDPDATTGATNRKTPADGRGNL